MKTAHRPHPTWAELASFDLGRLSDDAWVTISEHLAGCNTCCGLIDTIPQDGFVRELRSVPHADETEAKTDDRVGARTDVPAGLVGHSRYRVLEALGAGGMGTVFKAEHLVMGRLVAVKVLRPDLRDRKAVADRLATEVKALGRLSHPNLVAAFDAEYCGEELYVVMEYVEGESLECIIRRCGSLPFGLSCNWIGQAAAGLQYAFEHGLVHRDLKPANLLVTPQGNVKVLDFGLARLIDEQESASKLTPDGSIVGTPAYTAPEQARNPTAADIRSDLYSLGCTWYEMLTGRLPFPGSTTMQQLLAHQDQSPAPVTQTRCDIPRDAEDLFDRLLAKDPAARFQTPADFLEALKRLEQAPLQPPASQPAIRAGLPLLMAGVVIALVVLVGIGLWIRHLNSAAANARSGENGSSTREKITTERENPVADPLGKFRGLWVADVATGFRVEMQITMKDDKIEVSANYVNKKGQPAGSFVGIDATLKNGVLTFSQKFVKKPVSHWGDGKFHTLEMVSDNVLKFHWKGGGTEHFTRATALPRTP